MFLGWHGDWNLRDRQLADPAHGHPADRDVERPLQLQHPRLLLRRRDDLQQGEVHVVVLLVQSGDLWFAKEFFYPYMLFTSKHLRQQRLRQVINQFISLLVCSTDRAKQMQQN